MALVKSKPVMEAVYRATLRIGREAPTTPLEPMSTVFRFVAAMHHIVDDQRHVMRRNQADEALRIRGSRTDENRYTGNGPDGRTNRDGLYCSIQQQATVNERAHYAPLDGRPGSEEPASPPPIPRSEVLAGQYVIKIRLLGRWVAADLSPRHNPGASAFLNRIGADRDVQAAIRAAGYGTTRIEELIFHPVDCSVARGIGLAIDQTGWEALIVETARQSERSVLERGDNIIFFGNLGSVVRNLSPQEAWAFPPGGSPIRYVIQF